MKKYLIKKIKELYYKDNLTLQEVANILGYKSGNTISNILHKYNLPIKKSNFNSKNRKHKLDETYFENINSPNKAYIIGLILADGYVDEKWNKLVLTSKDKELVEYLQNELKSTHKLGKYKTFDKRTKKCYTRFSLQISSKKIVNDLNKLEIYSNIMELVISFWVNHLTNNTEICFISLCCAPKEVNVVFPHYCYLSAFCETFYTEVLTNPFTW